MYLHRYSFNSVRRLFILKCITIVSPVPRFCRLQIVKESHHGIELLDLKFAIPIRGSFFTLAARDFSRGRHNCNCIGGCILRLPVDSRHWPGGRPNKMFYGLCNNDRRVTLLL
jgi:hypothetical protein